MQEPGLMAPPTLYDEPARPGLMSPAASAPRLELSLGAALWSVATVLAAVELGVNLAL